MATINTNLAGVTSGSQYASAGNNTIYTNLPYNTAGTTTTNVTFYAGASASIDILYNQSFKVDSTVGFHELFGNIEVQGASSDYTVSSWYGKVTLTHKTSGQVISFQLTKPENAASNSGVNVEFLDGAIAFTSNVNAQGVWTVWATTGGTDTSTWGQGGLATQVPGTYSPGATPLDLSTAASVGYLNYSVNSSDVTDWTGGGAGATYTLTTGIDDFTGTPYNDTFNAAVNDFGTRQTLNAQDQLDGNGGIDTLNAELITSVTPLSLQNIEVVNVSVIDDTAVTLGLINSNAVEVLTNDGSVTGSTLTFSQVGATANQVYIYDTAGDTTVSYATTTGTQTVGLTLDNVSSAALVTMAGIENINITSGDGTSAANSIELDASGATTLTAGGTSALTLDLDTDLDLTRKVTSVDASQTSGGVTLTMIAQTGVAATTDISVLGGSGNDSITMTGVTQDYSVTLGDGNDTVTDTGITVTDTVIGGAGNDTLSTTSAAATALTLDDNNISGMDILTLSDDLADDLDVTLVDETITTLNLTGSDIVDGGVIAGAEGAFTVNLGKSAAGYAGQLNAALEIIDGGNSTADTLTIANKSMNSTTSTSNDVFDGNDVLIDGYETVTISTGTGSVSNVRQDINLLVIDGDSVTDNVSLTFTGGNSVDVNLVDSISRGQLTIDASGLTAQVAGTPTFDLAGVDLGTGGTVSATGSAGEDVLITGNFASTVIAGAGDDIVETGTKADSIDGGAGDDVLDGISGNDTIKGGEGDDLIFSTGAGVVSIEGGVGDDFVDMGSSLIVTAGKSDTVKGGAGIDQLNLTSTAAATQAVNVSEFEILSSSVNQVLSNFVNNTGWNAVAALGEDVAFTNAGSGVEVFYADSDASGDLAFSRLVDLGTNELAFAALDDVAVDSFTANDEEALLIDSDFGSIDIAELVGNDLNEMVIIGDHEVTIDNITVTTGDLMLEVIDASGLDAALIVNASESQADMTVLGGNFINDITTGSGDDEITGNGLIDILDGGDGDDSLTGGDGDDVLFGGQGEDVISSGEDDDYIDAGTGADSVTLATGGADLIVQETADSYASTSSNFSGSIAAGNFITFANGVDVVAGFAAGAGGDALVVDFANPASLLGALPGALTYSGYLSGDYNPNTGRFTVRADGLGADTMIVQIGGGDDITTNTSVVILTGVDSEDLTSDNFQVSEPVEAVYDNTELTVTGIPAGIIGVTLGADVAVTNAGDTVVVDEVDTYVDSEITTVDLSGLDNPTAGAVITITDADVDLDEVIGTTVGVTDVNINVNNAAFNATTTAVDFINLGVGVTAVELTADNNNRLNEIEEAGDVTVTVSDANMTIAGKADVETYILANGVNAITLGAGAQNVTTTGGTATIKTGALSAISGTLDATATTATLNVQADANLSAAVMTTWAAGFDAITLDTGVDIQATIAQNALITTAGGTNIVTLTDAGSTTGAAAVESYILANGTNTFVLGAAAQNVTGGTGADTVDVDTFAVTGTIALASGANVVSMATGSSLVGATVSATGGTWGLTIEDNASVTLKAANLTGATAASGITAAGAETVTVNTTSGVLTGYTLGSAVETWNIGTTGAGNNSVTLGAVGQTVTFGAGNDTLTTGTPDTLTGTLNGGGGTNTLVLENGDDIDAAVISNFTQVSIAAGASVTMSRDQNQAFTGTNTVGAGVTVNVTGDGAVTTITDVATYVIGDDTTNARTVTVTSAGTSVSATSATDAVTANLGTLTYTGTLTGETAGGPDDIVALSSGANISGATIGAGFVALTLANNASVNMTAAQWNAFTGTITAGVAETVTLSTAGTVTAAAVIENWNLANGTNTFTFAANTAQTVTGGTGADTINVALVTGSAVQTAAALGAGSADSVNINNAAVGAGTAMISITGFEAGNASDKISSQVGGVSYSGGTYYADFTGAFGQDLSNGDILEIDANTAQWDLQSPTVEANVLLWLTNNNVLALAGNEIATIVVYNGAGTAGVFQVQDTTGVAGSDFDLIELIGTVNAADNALVAGNFI